MNSYKGSIWDLKNDHWIVIPVNLKGINGAGLAKEAADRYHNFNIGFKALCNGDPIASWFYDSLTLISWFEYNDNQELDAILVTFPTKVAPQFLASLDMIELGCQKLKYKLDHLGTGFKVAMPLVGTGLGKLPVDIVRKVLDNHFHNEDRIVLVEL